MSDEELLQVRLLIVQSHIDFHQDAIEIAKSKIESLQKRMEEIRKGQRFDLIRGRDEGDEGSVG